MYEEMKSDAEAVASEMVAGTSIWFLPVAILLPATLA